MTDIEKLMAIEEIRQTKARYFRFVDTKNWEGLLALFTPDARIDITNDLRDDGLFDNVADFAKTAADGLVGCVSVHHGHMSEVEITSPTTANSITAMEDTLRWAETRPTRLLHGMGHYFETYERVNGKWLIKTMQLKRLRVDYYTDPAWA